MLSYLNDIWEIVPIIVARLVAYVVIVVITSVTLCNNISDIKRTFPEAPYLGNKAS